MKLFKMAGLAILWLAVILLFCRYITFAQYNRFALRPDWFQGNKNCLNVECSSSTMVEYSSRGFPVNIPGHATSGSFELARGINFGFAALVGALLALILVKRRRFGVILSLVFIFIVFLFNFIL